MREVVAETENPVMLYSIGKRQRVCCVWRRRRSTRRCRCYLEVPRHVRAARPRHRADRMKLLVYQNPEAKARWHQPVRPRLADPHRPVEDAGPEEGARPLRLRRRVRRRAPRRGEERAKERIFSVPQRPTAGTRRTSAPSCGTPTTRASARASRCVSPLSNWTELDVWQYIYLENIPIVPLYFAEGAAGRRARRHADHGRRRAHSAAPGRGAGDAQGSASARSAATR